MNLCFPTNPLPPSPPLPCCLLQEEEVVVEENAASQAAVAVVPGGEAAAVEAGVDLQRASVALFGDAEGGVEGKEAGGELEKEEEGVVQVTTSNGKGGEGGQLAGAEAAGVGEPAGRFYLRDINLEVEEGALVCVVGRVGSGKTSLISELNEHLCRAVFLFGGAGVCCMGTMSWCRGGEWRG